MRVVGAVLACALLTVVSGCGEHYEGGGRRIELPSGGTASSGGGPSDAVGEAGAPATDTGN